MSDFSNYSPKIAVLLLAAGQASRLGEPKQLLKWQGETLLEHSLGACLESAAAMTVTVLGAWKDEILRAVPALKQAGVFDTSAPEARINGGKMDCGSGLEVPERSRLIIAENSRWRDGMASSLVTGLKAAVRVFPEAEGVMICLADMPFLSSSLIDSVIATWSKSGPETARKRIAVPVFAGRRGHPVCFGSAFFAEMLELGGDRGAGSVIKKYPDQVIQIAASGPEIFMDCDCREDYNRCLNMRIANADI